MATFKDPFEAMLDRQIKGIRETRKKNQMAAENRVAYLDAEWSKLLESMQKLQAKFKDHPKVLHFVINADESEVSVKIRDTFNRRGHSFYILGRHHPEKKYPGMDVVWLSEPGGDEASFTEPADAMTEFVHRIAYKLA